MPSLTTNFLGSLSTFDPQRERLGFLGNRKDKEAEGEVLVNRLQERKTRAFCFLNMKGCGGMQGLSAVLREEKGGGQQGSVWTLTWVSLLSALQGHFLSCWSPCTFLD